MSELQSSLRAADSVAAVTAPEARAIAAQRLRRRQAAGAAAAVLVLLAIGVGLAAMDKEPSATVSSGPGPVDVWLQADPIPSGDQQLIRLTVVNESAERLTYGTEVAIEVFADGGWKPLYRVATSTLPEGPGKVVAAEQEFFVHTAALFVEPAEEGTSERFEIPMLADGRYRLVKTLRGSDGEAFPTSLEFEIG